MKKRLLLVFVAALVMMLSLSACGSLKEISNLGDTFMSALSTGDNATSYAMLSEDIQAQVGYETGWAEWAAIRDFSEWKFTSNSIENDIARLEGTALLDGDEYKTTLEFTKSGDDWQLTTIIFE